MRVHILVTVRNRALSQASGLVFKTLRTGFPTAEVIVYGHGLDLDLASGLKAITERVGAQFVQIPLASHGAWIEQLLASETEPFWICDTDIVFFDSVENWFGHSQALFAGRIEPEFLDKWTQTEHVERLHPSLMWINPQPLRIAIRGWPGTQEFFNSVNLPLIQWSFIPRKGKPPLFYDTTAGLWHAFEGRPFTEEQNEAFEHLFCGTYSDLNTGIDLRNDHDMVFKDLNSARGLWKKQQAWYSKVGK